MNPRGQAKMARSQFTTLFFLIQPLSRKGALSGRKTSPLTDKDGYYVL